MHTVTSKNAEICLIVPNLSMFKKHSLAPWGVFCIREYLVANGIETVRIIDFNKEDVLLDFFNNYRNVAKQFLQFISNNILHWKGHNISEEDLLCILGAYTDETKSFKPEFTHQFTTRLIDKHGLIIKEIANQFNVAIKTVIEKKFGKVRPNVFGISAYSESVAQSLSVSGVLKNQYSDSYVVLGGTAITSTSIPEILKDNFSVDGVVLGYGENALYQINKCFRENGAITTDTNIEDVITRKNLSKYKSYSHLPFRIDDSVRQMIEKKSTEYVKRTEKDVVHVLVRRGCGWGLCTFCSDLDRKDKIDIKLDNIRKTLISAIDEIEKEYPAITDVKIRLDADNHDEKQLNYLWMVLLNDCTNKFKFQCSFHIRLSELTPSLLNKIKLLSNKNLQILPQVGVETLNRKSLIKMRKGITPLQIVEKVKSLTDINGQMYANYFMFFPGENSADVKEEVKMLVKTAHLFHTGISIFQGFMANDNSDMCLNQNQFGIRVFDEPDPILKTFFGLNLKWSNYGHRSYELVNPKNNLSSQISNLYFKLLFKCCIPSVIPYSWKHDLEHSIILRLRNFISNKIHMFSDIMDLNLTRICFGLLQILTFNYWYLFKLIILTWIMKLNENNATGSSRKPYFRLEGNKLKKKYPWFLGGSWTRKIDDQEKQLLKYLYVRRNRSELNQKFGHVKEIDSLLKKHLSIGTIIRYKTNYLAVVNCQEHAHDYLSEVHM